VDPLSGWSEPSNQAATTIRAEARSLAAGLAERLDSGAPDWCQAWVEAAHRAATAIEAELASVDTPTEPGAHAALARLYADGDLVYTASSMPIRDQEAFLRSTPAR